MVMRDHARYQRTCHRNGVSQIENLAQLFSSTPRSAANLDDNSLGGQQRIGGPCISTVIRGRTEWWRGAHGKLFHVEAVQHCRLRVHRRQQVKRPRSMWMVNRIQTSPQCCTD